MNKKTIGVGVGVIILKDNKVLLGLRNPDPKITNNGHRAAGTWTMPGGKLEYGESFEQTGIREVKEETDLNADYLEVFCVQNDCNEHAHFVTIGMIAHKYSGTVKTMEPNKIIKWRWFDLNKLPAKMYFPSAKCLEKYRAGLFYKQS